MHLPDHIGLVLKWTCVQLFGKVGIGSRVLRAVLCMSVPGHQSGLLLDLDLDLHLLLP